jgi:uncharacterized protein (DUF1697 family)
MGDARYLALLRGINVGGNNVIRMADLRSCFENLGLREVATYIQSGNVVFLHDGKDDEAKLLRRIERCLAESFGLRDCVVLVDRRRLEKIVSEAPRGFGTSPDTFRYDVIFLRKPMTPSEAVNEIRAREGVDAVHTGSDALYFSRLISRASQSYLARVTQLPVYKFMTIRNWNTTTKLLGMMT